MASTCKWMSTADKFAGLGKLLSAFSKLTYTEKVAVARFASSVLSTNADPLEFGALFFLREGVDSGQQLAEFISFAKSLDELAPHFTEFGYKVLATEIWSGRNTPNIDSVNVNLHTLWAGVIMKRQGLIGNDSYILLELVDSDLLTDTRKIDLAVYQLTASEPELSARFLVGRESADMRNVIYRAEVKSGTKSDLYLDNVVIERLQKDFRARFQRLAEQCRATGTATVDPGAFHDVRMFITAKYADSPTAAMDTASAAYMDAFQQELEYSLGDLSEVFENEADFTSFIDQLTEAFELHARTDLVTVVEDPFAS